MVVSTDPLILGNSADAEDARAGHAVVAFLGQVIVRARGAVAPGDFLVPSGREDGTAVAVAPAELDARELGRVIGTAWERAAGEGEGRVRAAVGVHQAAAAASAVERLERELALQRERLEALAARVEAMDVSQ
jgi:hypothetical protein